MHFEFYKNVLLINNYRQIILVKNDLIKLEKIDIYGKNLNIIKLSRDEIVIRGNINEIMIGE